MECPECGGDQVKTEIVTETKNWGWTGETFEATFPVRTCDECYFSWIDEEASEAITVAQFKFEQAKGIKKDKFCNEREKKLWGDANAETGN
jgi:hypothetical protein